MTGSGAVFHTLQAKQGQSVAVFGSGGVGFGAIWAAKLSGCTPIIAIDLSENRLALAKELGATHTINPKTTKNVLQAIRDLADGYGVDNALETTGNEKVLRQCCDAVGAAGKVAVIGAGMGTTLHYEVSQFIEKGTQIMGVCMGACTPQKVDSPGGTTDGSTSPNSSSIIARDNSLLIGYPSFSRLKRLRRLCMRCMMEALLNRFLSGDELLECRK
jgi:Zn-dependent alcohol dehydrogenase